MKVLVVDDYDTMLKIISNMLEQMGVKDIVLAKDGGQAFEKLSNGGIDLIISDWNMEPVTGLEFLQRVRACDNPKIKATPFIMVTAESKPENIIAAKKAGVNNYIVKPFNVDILKEKIVSVLKKVSK